MWHQWFNLNFMKLLFVHKESKILFTNIFSFLSVLDGRSWQYHAFVWWWAEECTRMRRGTLKNKKKKRKWCVIKYGDPYSEFVPIHLTHPSAHTYSINTHTEQWAANAAVPGEQLWFGALLKSTSVMILREERALVIHSPTYHPCWT